MKKTIVALTILLSMAFAASAQQTGEIAAPRVKQSEFALRINLPYLVAATPFVGFEWKPTQKFGILVNGAYSDWDWKDGDRHMALWQVNPELRYYFNKCWYIGASGEKGEFNIKLNDHDGRDGEFYGGGLTGGYKARLGRKLDLDFNVSFGYAEYNYDKYNMVSGQKTITDKEERYWWGPYQAGIVLCWRLGK